MLAQNKKAAEEKLQKENRRQLSELSKQPGNNICCDCTAQRPSWASTNLGIFICLRCAGIHRSLGSHISFVRSITMDDWTPKQMETMFAIGNVKSTQYYERNKPADRKKPTEFDGVDLLRNHITDKYVMRKFVDKTVSSPSELLEKARLEKEKQKKATKSSSSKLSLNTTDARMKKEELQAKKLKKEQLKKKKKAAAAAKHESEDEEESDDSEDDDFKSSKKVKKPEKKRSTALLSFDFSDGIESVSPTVGDAKDAKSSGEDENESGDDDFGSKTKKKTKSKRVNNKDEEEEEVKKTKKTSTKKSKKSSDADESEGKKKKKKVSCKSSKSSSDHTTNGSQDTAESTYDFLLHDEQPQSKSSAASVKDLTDFLGDLTIDDAPPKPLSIEEFEQQLKMNLMFDMKTAPAVQTPDEDALAAPLIASPAINPSNLSVQKDELVNNEGRSRSASLVSLGDEVNEDRVAVMSNEHDQDSDEDQMDFSSDSDDDFSSSKKKKTKVVQEEEKPKKKKKKSSDDSSTTKKKKSIKKKSKEDTEADGEKKKKKKKKETSDD